MRVLLIAGSHPRHRFLAEPVIEVFGKQNIDLIVMEREALVPDSSRYGAITKQESALFDHHFGLRSKLEVNNFGSDSLTDQAQQGWRSYIVVPPTALNSTQVIRLVQEAQADFFVSIGPGIFKEEFLSFLPEVNLNVHLGLSPRYRGSATLFWPSYFLEPWFSGVTFHKISRRADAGPVVHQSIPLLDKSMGVHETAIASTIAARHDLGKLLLAGLKKPGHLSHGLEQSGPARTFASSDFHPRHLVPIYELFDGQIVAASHMFDGAKYDLRVHDFFIAENTE